MAEQDSKRRFHHRRVAGVRHHTYDVDVNELTYAISLNGRLLRTSALGALVSGVDGASAVEVRAIDDIETLKGMNEE